MKFLTSLPMKLLLGVIAGIAVGQFAGVALMNVVVTVRYILGQLILFCVPLIIIGFIAPSITRLGNNASKMLGVAVTIAYISSIGAALFSMAAGYIMIPNLSIVTNVEGLQALPDLVFKLDIPPIMSVMSALALSMCLGLAAAWTKAKSITNALEEFQLIVLAIVTKIVIPLLPFFIAFTFCSLSYEGSITKQLPVFIQVILIVMAGHYIWMALLYGLAGIYTGKNPFDIIKNCRRNDVLRRDARRRSALREEVRAAAPRRHGRLRHPALREHPPLRLRFDRGLLRHDDFEDSLRRHSSDRDDGALLPAPRHLRDSGPRRPGRHGHGLARPHHGHPRL